MDAPAAAKAATDRSRAHVDAPAAGTAGSGRAHAHLDAPSRLDVAVLRVEARAALTQLGWKPAIAQAAVTAALAAHGTELTLEQLIFESLRRCPAPRA